MITMYTVAEAASLLECSPAFIYRLISLGKIRSIHGYVSAEDLLEYKRKKNDAKKG